MNPEPEAWGAGDLIDNITHLTFTTHRLAAIIEDRPTTSLPVAADLLLELRDARRLLGEVEQMLEDWTGDLMHGKTEIVEGVGGLSRSGRLERKKWANDDLLRAVLDSRLVNEATGEVIDESPLDRVLHVWNLGAPRTTALRARRIDPDEFCVVERRPGWKVRVDG